MTDQLLSIQSAKALALAHRLARIERRSITDVVERALEAYDATARSREPAASFYARLTREHGEYVELESIIRENRTPHSGPSL